ncbi:YbaB/EbfC family nucleoid-associated protein [Phytoactinopolyspora alkaliphila]|uniref:Nucleoid-associated protein G1H11_11015 n=1 Tax=Phytoactinopolyspora alkaliphila TaxID=1783498 RepID=A0A6N9YLH1_9ACTN|nr:YbaB/EbfC family nucleoid-associated protein [Phytoactinopolyspora alkaliphila]NED95843.1 YbaB/EbfC family nucleoid-associated protein [Phytoactinopolyspora alkaliphila]
MGQLLQQAQRMQEELMSAQQDLADSEVTGSAGGGLVQATMTGGGELVGMRIDPAAVDPEDTETLGDLVVAAVRDAQAEVQRLASQQLGSINANVEGLLGGGTPGGPLIEGSASSADEPGDADSPPGHRA